MKVCLLLPAESPPYARRVLAEAARRHGVGALPLSSGLARGLREAHEQGYSHALAWAPGARPRPELLPHLLATVKNAPDTIFLSAPPEQRRDLLTRIETGRDLPLDAGALCAYPLALLEQLSLSRSEVGFAQELLVKAAWAGLPIGLFPGEAVGSEEPMPLATSVRRAWLHLRLATQSLCLPAPYLALRSRQAHRSQPWRTRCLEIGSVLLHEPGRPSRVAGSVGLGLFMGLSPFWGLQTACTLLLAHCFNLSKPVALLANNVFFPLLTPLAFYASLVLGRVALAQPGLERSLTTIELAAADFPAWVVGSLLLGAATALVGALSTYAFLSSGRRLLVGVRSGGSPK